MRIGVRVVVSVFLLLAFVMTQALGQEAFQGVSIKAVKSIQLGLLDDKHYTCDVVVQIDNPGDVDLKLTGYDLEVQFEGKDMKGEVKKVLAGKAKLRELPLAKDAITEVKLSFDVGPNDPKTRSRLVDLFGIIGNPQSAPTMHLSGENGEVGTEGPHGWYYKATRVELSFTPSIQREVLFD